MPSTAATRASAAQRMNGRDDNPWRRARAASAPFAAGGLLAGDRWRRIGGRIGGRGSSAVWTSHSGDSDPGHHAVTRGGTLPRSGCDGGSPGRASSIAAVQRTGGEWWWARGGDDEFKRACKGRSLSDGTDPTRATERQITARAVGAGSLGAQSATRAWLNGRSYRFQLRDQHSQPIRSR